MNKFNVDSTVQHTQNNNIGLVIGFQNEKIDDNTY